MTHAGDAQGAPKAPERPIDAAWRTYLRDVMPVTAGPTQVIETRRAFFAGAVSMMEFLSREDRGEELTDAEVEARAKAIEREIREYARSLRG